MRVKLFARARDLAGGRDEIEVLLPAGATVAMLRQAVAAQVPALGGFVGRCAVAVCGAYAVDADVVAGDEEVALLPPVSGGV